MGHIKNIAQMIQDGSFDREFMPAYQNAITHDQKTFIFAGKEYGTNYGASVVEFVSKTQKS